MKCYQSFDFRLGLQECPKVNSLMVTHFNESINQSIIDLCPTLGNYAIRGEHSWIMWCLIKVVSLKSKLIIRWSKINFLCHRVTNLGCPCLKTYICNKIWLISQWKCSQILAIFVTICYLIIKSNTVTYSLEHLLKQVIFITSDN